MELSGRAGLYSEVNGRYELTPSTWVGQPVYAHTDREQTLRLFFSTGYWVLAPEVRSLPRAVARCHASAGAPHVVGLASSGPWEFLQGETSQGSLVTMQTRTYEPDRAFTVRVVCAEGSPPSRGKAEGPGSAEGPAVFDPPPRPSAAPAPAKSEAAGPVVPQPAWVREAIAELIGGEVRVVVAACEGVSVDLRKLSLDVAPKTLKVGLNSSEVLELSLPAAVDVEADPVARWSEKTRTLKVRLALAPSATGAASAG